MTQQQWDQHIDHFQGHINWPASKAQIVKACEGVDVEQSVMDELKNMPDKQYQNENEVKQTLIQ